ncbi:hypothetical protein CYLTODRAFT_419134 [Cylindrobasidium torrendii FP15055 ss-10]|uniref:Core domain-containing protein n=1 Tax=Cylindrobasidium torrendii FP15055 ss-10 TaxID=1314674 RepID=A0A0D7BKX5_9AGAR|nr:hypothetical protein CYLTODRAFT_419134 [Cylindrobasidium torrendii FP15055 ss-10]
MSLLRSVRCLSRAVSRPPAVIRRAPSALLSRSFQTSTIQRIAIQRPSATQTKVVSSPSKEYLEEEEIDVELIPSAKIAINVTDRAAEQLRTIAQREGNPDAALRIAVESGGCHGYQYKMELARERVGDDYHLSHPTIQPSNLLVDAVSLTLLNGATLDYATELIGSTFRIAENPNAKGSGCGCGVSWELKE